MRELKQLWEEFASFEGSLFRYSLAFSFLLALFPLLLLVIMLFQNSVFDIEIIFEYLYHFVPENLIGEFVNYVMNQNYPNLFSVVITLIAALNLASRIIYSFLLISANTEEFNLPKIVIRFKSYFVFILLMLSIVIIAFLAGIVKTPISITITVGLFVAFYLLYRMLSFEKKPLLYGVIGAIFAMASITITGQVFFKMVNYFTTYSSLYGPIASLVIALLSIYVISSLIYFGYCLNVVYGPSYPEPRYKKERLYHLLSELIDKVKMIITYFVEKKF